MLASPVALLRGCPGTWLRLPGGRCGAVPGAAVVHAGDGSTRGAKAVPVRAGPCVWGMRQKPGVFLVLGAAPGTPGGLLEHPEGCWLRGLRGHRALLSGGGHC